MGYLRLIHDHDDRERRFQADLHGRQMAERDGRVHGMRQQLAAQIHRRGRH